jgi:hypothetical protein
MKANRCLTYNLSAGLFDRKRKLRLHPDYVEYEDSYLEPGVFTRIDKADMLDVKFNMNWIIWYRFFVGCDFRIDIKTRENGIFKIKFASYFRKNNVYIEAFNQIVDWMWEHYLKDIINLHLQRFSDLHDLKIGGLRLTDEGIHFTDKEQHITWAEVAVKEYESYFAVYDENNPELNKRIMFDEWESEILLGMIEALKEKP